MLNEPPIVYKPIGRCIYCGVVSTRLGKEHIVPLGLDGGWILPRSSCHRCAKATGEVEQKVLHMMFGPARIRLNMATRNPSKRPRELDLHYANPRRVPMGSTPVTALPAEVIDGHTISRRVAAKDYPFSLWGLELPPPGLFEGRPPSNQNIGKLWVHTKDDEIRKFQGGRFAPPVILGRINQYAFFRMLAKIAHSYAIADHGIDTFKPLLLDLIFGKDNAGTHWIGTVRPRPVPERTNFLHGLDSFRRMVNGIEYIIAHIYLFYCYGAPVYEVVVGESTVPRELVDVPASQSPRLQ